MIVVTMNDFNEESTSAERTDEFAFTKTRELTF